MPKPLVLASGSEIRAEMLRRAGLSVAVILRSRRVAGRVLQGGYNPANNTVVQRDGPTQIPYDLTA